MTSSLIAPRLPDQHDIAVTPEQCFANARIVLEDRVITGAVHLDGTRIAAVTEGDHVPAGALDMEGDTLVLSITDSAGAVAPQITRATLGRASHVYDDQELSFNFDGRVHRAPIIPLAPGNWNLRLAAETPDGTLFKQRVKFRVRQ